MPALRYISPQFVTPANQIRTQDGGAATPPMSYELDTDSGFFRLAANQVAAALGGVIVGSWEGQRYRVAANTALTAGGVALAGLVFGSSNNIGIFFGSGNPTLSAAKGSLYLRSDGLGPTSRLYCNTDGATTWTAVTTSA